MPPSSPAPGADRPALLVLGATVVAVVAFGGVVFDGLVTGRLPLVGAPGGEVWGHAWVQWWHADALPGWPDGPGQWITGARDWPVIDPLPTLLAALVGRVAGPILAYDFVVLLGILGAFVGGALLARSQRGDPLVGGLALALAPSFLGSVASGLTEDLALGLAAVGLGWVGHADWRRAAGAGVCLGLLTACGLVLAWAAAVAAVGLGLWSLWRSRERRSVALGLAGGGLLAGVLAVPTAWMHADRLGGAGHRLGAFVPRMEPLWRLNPWKGADLASFVVPGRVDPADALVRMHPGYLGLSLLALAAVAGRSRWWVVVVAFVLVAPGAHLSFAGTPLGVDNPAAALLAGLPFGSLINHHGRLLLIVAVALAALSARGARLLQDRHGSRARWLVLAVVAVDLALLGPVGAPLPTASAEPLAVYTLPDFPAPGDRPLLQLPAAGPGIHFQRPLLDQAVHRHRLVLDPNRPGLPPSLARSDSGRFLSALAAPDGPPVPARFEWPASIGHIVVSEPYVDGVAAVLGPPTLTAADSALWTAP